MSIVRLKKVTFLGHVELKDRVIEDLQTLGCPLSDAWKPKEPGPLTKDYNEELSDVYGYLFRYLHRDGE